MIAPAKHHIAGSGPIRASSTSGCFGEVTQRRAQLSCLTVPHCDVSGNARLRVSACVRDPRSVRRSPSAGCFPQRRVSKSAARPHENIGVNFPFSVGPLLEIDGEEGLN